MHVYFSFSGICGTVLEMKKQICITTTTWRVCLGTGPLSGRLMRVTAWLSFASWPLGGIFSTLALWFHGFWSCALNQRPKTTIGVWFSVHNGHIGLRWGMPKSPWLSMTWMRTGGTPMTWETSHLGIPTIGYISHYIPILVLISP